MESNKNIAERAKILIAEGKLEQVISFMSNLNDIDTDFKNEIILLTGRYKNLQSDKLLGDISTREYNKTILNISHSLLVILDEIENWQPKDKKTPNFLSRIWSFFSENSEKETIKQLNKDLDERMIAEQILWNKATSLDTINGYLTFIKNSPKSPFIKNAKKRMDGIADENLWKKAKTQNTIEAYSNYINKYKKGIFVESARMYIAKQNVIEIDENIWKKAKNEDSLIAYQEYLNEFPNGIFVVEAKKRIKELLEIKEIENTKKRIKEIEATVIDDNNEAIDIKEESINFNVFEDKKIRKIWHNEEWWFAVEDVIEVLTESKNPKAYTNALLRKEPHLKDVTLYFKASSKGSDKQQQYLRFSQTEGLLRIILSVPSPKAMPFKLWLAQTGKQAIDEIENPFYTVVVKIANSNLNFDKYGLENFINWGKKYGEGHFIIAALAAFPLHITADLLYTIWQNFKVVIARNEATEGVTIPRVAVSDLLLSGLLHEVSTELFEYAPDLRRNLLQALQEYHGERDILKELGEFMLDYLAMHYAEGVAYTEPIREAEEWNALAYYAPAQANAKLAAALNPSAAKNYQTRQLRAVFLAEKLQDQSAIRKLDPSVQEGFERVLTISKGIKPYIQGNFGEAYAQFQQLPDLRIQDKSERFTEGVATLQLPKEIVSVPNNEDLQEEISRKLRLEEQINYIKAKNSNYIFIFGNAGAGKTTVSASLIYFLSNDSNGVLRIVRSDNNAAGEELGRRIRKEIEEGNFPYRTKTGTVTQIDLEYTPHDNSKKSVFFTLLEMSGETLKNVSIVEKGKFLDDIDAFFMIDKLKMIFILVTSPDQARKDTNLFEQFLDYIVQKNGRFYNSNFIVLLSKWDKHVREEVDDLKSFVHRQSESGVRVDLVGEEAGYLEYFVSRHFYSIYKKIFRPNAQNAIMPYSIGKVDIEEESDRITEFNFKYPEALWKHIYKAITGTTLESPPPTALPNFSNTIWERLRGWLLGE